MAVHLISKKPIVFPAVADSGRILAPPASGTASEHGDDAIDPNTIDIQFTDDTAPHQNQNFPTVVSLKDGPYKSDTDKTQWLDNSFQKALLRAQERLAGGSYPREQEEWRLPHAPVPSRPDFSRVVPVRDERKGRKKKKRKHKRKDDDNTKEKISEPEYILPPLPIPTMYQNALSDMAIAVPSTKLTKNIMTSTQPVYLPFVGSASLHPKSLTTTVPREPQNILPGLCHGCRGLPHIHDFKGYLHLDSEEEGDADVSESGRGGSLYEDEPEDEGMMGAVGLPVGTTSCSGCAISETPHFHYNTVKVNPIDTPPPSQFSSNDSGHYDAISHSYDFSSVASPDHISVTIEETAKPSASAHEEILFSVEKINEPHKHRHKQTVPRQKPLKVPQWIMDLVKDPNSANAAQKIRHYEDHCYACEQALRQILPQLPNVPIALKQLLPEYRQPGKFLGEDLHIYKGDGPHGHGDNSEVASTSGIGTSIFSEAEILKLEEDERIKAEEEDAKERQRRELEKQKEEEKEQEKIKKADEEKERKKNLYKAPKQFKPKKQEHQVTTGEDPFSKDRSYNIPKNKGFQVKKSDKQLTTHVDIERDESTWKQPKKFELAKGPKKVTKADWKFSEKKERLRPPTPPPPPPPVKKKPTTVPVLPKKREPAEAIASLREPAASPPRKRKVEEKPKPKTKPEPLPPPKVKTPPPPPPPPAPVEKKVAEPKKVTKVAVKLAKKSKKVSKARKKKRIKKKKKPKETKQQAAEPEEPTISDSESSVSSLSSSSSLESLSSPPITPSQIPLPPSPPPTPSQIPLPPSPPPPSPSTVSLPPPTPAEIPLPSSPPDSPTLLPKQPTPPPPKEPTPPPPKEPTPPPPKEPTPLPPKEPTPLLPKEPTPPPPKESTPLPPKDPTPPPPKPKPKPKAALPKPKATVSKPPKPKKAKPKREKKKAPANRKVINKPKPALPVVMELGTNLPTIQIDNFPQLEETSAQSIKEEKSMSPKTQLTQPFGPHEDNAPHLPIFSNLPKEAWLNDSTAKSTDVPKRRQFKIKNKSFSSGIDVKDFPLNMPPVFLDDFMTEHGNKQLILENIQELDESVQEPLEFEQNDHYHFLESAESSSEEDDFTESLDMQDPSKKASEEELETPFRNEANDLYIENVNDITSESGERSSGEQFETTVPKVEPPPEPEQESPMEEESDKESEAEVIQEASEPESEDAAPQKKAKMPKLPKAMFKKKLPLVIKEFVRKERKITAPWLMPEIPKWKNGSEHLPDWPEDAPPELRALRGAPPPLPDIPLPKPKLPTPPPEPEPKPKLPPPPKVKKKPEPIIWRKRPVYKPKKRKIRAVKAESPEPEPEPEYRDALDFLAKYCIVHKDRVPHYKYVFNNHLEKTGILEPVAQSTVRHRLSSLSSAGSALTNEEQADENEVVQEQKEEETFEETFGQTDSDAVNEDNYVSPLDLNAVDEDGAVSDDDSEMGDNKPVFVLPLYSSLDVEGHLDKLAFTVGNLLDKTANFEEEIVVLRETKQSDKAYLARHEFPEILRADYNPEARVESPKKKKNKKKKKSKGKGNDTDPGVVAPPENNSLPSTPVRLCTPHVDDDDWVLGRLNEEQNKQLESIPEIRSLSLRLERTQEKLSDAKDRMKNLMKEKEVVTMMGRNIKNEEASKRPAASDDFRRRQSGLYKDMNPEQVYDIDVPDVEPLLRQVNRHLITEKECQYVYHVLDLPQRHHLDFKLFTIVAALSEKVSNLEPFIRKMINKMDFEALDVKMSKAKELFYLLEDENDEFRGSGEIPLQNMKVDLEAGGLSQEHVQMVMEKLGREGKHTVDFLDFLTYILLFIDIHDYILTDPLNSSRDR